MDEVFEQRELGDVGMNAGELRTNLFNVLGGLQANPGTPVVVNVRNRPTAVLIDLAAYRQMKEEAEAYRLLQLAEEADLKPKMSAQDFLADMMQARAERRAA